MAASFFFGSVSSWTAPACSCPLIADITTQEERNCAYGVEWALEAVFGAFTPMYMGKIIETAGYLVSVPAEWQQIAQQQLVYEEA